MESLLWNFLLLATQGLDFPNNVFKAKKSDGALFLMSSFEGRELNLPEPMGEEFIMEFFYFLIHKFQC